MSQNARILNHLKSGNKLTPLAALRQFGCLRLAARIYDLRNKGWDIMERRVNRGTSRVSEYYLNKGKRG